MKNKLREQVLKKREGLPTLDILEKSNEVFWKLHGMLEFTNAKTIFSYISFGSEVNTHGIIRASLETKRIVVPVIEDTQKKKLCLSELRDWKELSSGSFGILEPKKEFIRIIKNEIDVALIPGIAFDIQGNRIGYGGGYYDRLLKKIEAIKIGLAFENQIVECVPTMPHDIAMEKIVTEKRIIDCQSGECT